MNKAPPTPRKSSPESRVAIFIDAANIFYSQKTLNWKVDYQKLLQYFQKLGKVENAYFYTAVISTNQKQLKFFKALKKIGYTVVTKEVKIIHDKKNHKTVQKGNFDVKVAIDLVLKAKEFDIAVLVSGDSDFEPAIEYLRSQKKKILVVSSRGHVSRELIKASDKYIPLEKIKSEVKKEL